MRKILHESRSLWHRVWFFGVVLVLGFAAFVFIGNLIVVPTTGEWAEFLGMSVAFTVFIGVVLAVWTAFYWMTSGHYPLSWPEALKEFADAKTVEKTGPKQATQTQILGVEYLRKK